MHDLISWIYTHSVNIHYGGEEDTFGHPYTVRVFDGIKEHRKFYKEAFQETGINAFGDFMRDYWMKMYIQALKDQTGSTPEKEELFHIKSFCYSRIALLKEWVMDDCETDTSEFAALMLSNVPPCLKTLNYKAYLTTDTDNSII